MREKLKVVVDLPVSRFALTRGLVVPRKTVKYGEQCGYENQVRHNCAPSCSTSERVWEISFIVGADVRRLKF